MPQSNETIPQTYPAWTWHSGTEVGDLRCQEIAARPLNSGEVWVKNAAIGLNPVDWKVLGPALGWQPGHVPGVDGAGTVVAVADGVPTKLLGQRVAYHQSLTAHGSYAAYTPIRAEVLMRLPKPLDFTTAASFPCPGLTAWQAIEKIPAPDGAALLISGAGGGVGNYLVQYAMARGFTVTVMCNPRHWERLGALGASACIAGPLPQGQSWQTGDGSFYAVIDCVSEDHAARLAPALKANGHLVCIQGRVTEWPCPPFGRALSVHEVALGALHQHGDSADWTQLTADGETLLAYIAVDRLEPETQEIRPFAELPELLEALKHRNFSGKALIRL
ncbi:MAG: zinc-binding dehydrogenase [Rhizomicrobium sp.]